MGLIRVCPGCESRYSLAELECPVCGISPDGAPIRDEALPDPVPHPARAIQGGNGLALLMALTTPSKRFILCFDMVNLPIDHRTGIGRDHDFCPIAEHLGKFRTTSRRHALVWIEGETLCVEHLGQNPTWINGQVCRHRHTYRLTDGDTVEFGPGLRARVSRVEADG